MAGQNVVLFDGGCGFCSRIVQFAKPRMRSSTDPVFVSLHSEEGKTMQENLPLKFRQIDSLIFVNEQKVFTFSSAVLRCVMKMKWYYAAWFPFLWVIPIPIRNLVYRLIAKSRHSLSQNLVDCDV